MTERDPAPPRRRWLTLALLASLAANLFLVGLIGGQVFSVSDEAAPATAQGVGGSRGGSRGYSLHPRVMREALAEERQDDIRAFTRTVRPEIRENWQGLRTAWQEIDAALRAQPFDPEALRAAKRREIDIRLAMRGLYNDRSSAFFATLTDAEREAVADLASDNLEKQMDRWRERRRQRDAAERAAAQASRE